MAKPVEAVQCSIRVIRCLAEAQRPMAFGAIAEATGVAGATLHRILLTLKVEGAAGEPADKRWELTPEFLVLVERALGRRLEAHAADLLRITQACHTPRSDT